MNGAELISLLENTLPQTVPVISAIVGSLLTALFLRHNTSTQEFEKIKAGHFKDVIDDLLDSGKMTYTEYYKANNFLNIASIADQYYSEKEKGKSNPEEPYDFDWFVRFYEAVGNVSDAQMQDLWARILSGEICSPGSISYKLIDSLKNMSKKDAELFSHLCINALNSDQHTLIPHYDNYMDELGIKYSDILRLEELDLINSDGSLTLKVSWNSNPKLLLYNDNIVLLLSSFNANKNIEIQQFPFTTVGCQLYRILNFSNSDICIRLLSKEISKNKNFHIELHRVLEHVDNRIKYSLEELSL